MTLPTQISSSAITAGERGGIPPVDATFRGYFLSLKAISEDRDNAAEQRTDEQHGTNRLQIVAVT